MSHPTVVKSYHVCYYHDRYWLSRRACLGLPPQNYMMLEHKVPSLMAGLAAERTSAAIPTATKPLVKLLPPQAANGNHHTVPVENGVPHLNGTTSNGVH